MLGDFRLWRTDPGRKKSPPAGRRNSSMKWTEINDGYPGQEYRSGDYTVLDFDVSEPETYPCDVAFAYFNFSILAAFPWAEDDYKDFADNPTEAAKVVCGLHAEGKWTPDLQVYYKGDRR